MPHSLKSKIKSLCYKGEITEQERDRIIKALEQEPSEEQEPKIGHWVVISSENGKYICECSECKDEVWFKDAGRKWNYCSNCGARMIDSEGEE